MSKDQQVAFISGANRGIGLETARELGKQGITVVIGARSGEKGAEAAALLRKEGYDAESVIYDAARPGSDRVVYDYLAAKHGRLDILVNNAGELREALFGSSLPALSASDLRATFDTNFFAVVALTQTLLPLLQKSKAGRIVNVSSVLGSLAAHTAPESQIAGAKAFAYNASKTALNAFTVHLAYALRETAIKVNSAHPGWVKTELGGAAAPMELADGGKTSARLATLDASGANGGFFHMSDTLPW
jgi:NAD(P)-dependent dehydrogenase (short-subunit alcohol dehydrogenase family)